MIIASSTPYANQFFCYIWCTAWNPTCPGGIQYRCKQKTKKPTLVYRNTQTGITHSTSKHMGTQIVSDSVAFSSHTSDK